MTFSWGGGATAENNAGVGLTDTGPYLVLDSGDTIGPASTFTQYSYSVSLSQSMVHYWGGMSGYLGVKFMNEETGELNYGYVHMMTTAFSSFPAMIFDCACDKTGAVITIPKPRSVIATPQDLPYGMSILRVLEGVVACSETSGSERTC